MHVRETCRQCWHERYSMAIQGATQADTTSLPCLLDHVLHGGATHMSIWDVSSQKMVDRARARCSAIWFSTSGVSDEDKGPSAITYQTLDEHHISGISKYRVIHHSL